MSAIGRVEADWYSFDGKYGFWVTPTGYKVSYWDATQPCWDDLPDADTFEAAIKVMVNDKANR